MDHTLAHLLNGLFVHHDGLEDPFDLYAQVSEFLFAGLLVVLGAVGLRARDSNLLATSIAAAASTALALVIGVGIADLVGRARPFVSDPTIHLFLAHGRDPGFPSDHTTAAFAIGTAIWLRHRAAGAVVLVAAAVLALDRVALGLHWPSDVLAGALLGTGIAVGIHLSPARALIDRAAAAIHGAVARLVSAPLSR